MSTPADVIRLPSPRPRFPAIRKFRVGDFPLIPALILGSIAFVALFANVLAPHNPEIGSLSKHNDMSNVADSYRDFLPSKCHLIDNSRSW